MPSPPPQAQFDYEEFDYEEYLNNVPSPETRVRQNCGANPYGPTRCTYVLAPNQAGGHEATVMTGTDESPWFGSASYAVYGQGAPPPLPPPAYGYGGASAAAYPPVPNPDAAPPSYDALAMIVAKVNDPNFNPDVSPDSRGAPGPARATSFSQVPGGLNRRGEPRNQGTKEGWQYCRRQL